MIGFLVLLVLTGGFSNPQDVSAPSDRPVGGILWHAPEELAAARADLRRMAALGAAAVRTDVIRRERLLETADSLGIALFQELPIARLPAEPLLDSTESARARLIRVLDRARDHPSARHFGLARDVDTSSPRACRYFETLARVAETQAPPGTRTYYTTWFTEHDACADRVDLVLLTGSGDVSPVERLRRWRNAHPGLTAGLGAVGTWTDPERSGGRLVAHSPQAQARYLENRLRELMTLNPPPATVFVRQWRDPDVAVSAERARLSLASSQRWGISGRPAERVVRGFFTGERTAFAFPAGTPGDRSPYGRILMGWVLVIGLGLLYALSPRFRKMVPRYALNHRFYQDALRRGREVIPTESTVLLLLICGATGLSVDVWIRAFDGSTGAVMLASWMPTDLRFWMGRLLENLWALIVLVGAVTGLTLTLWTGWITFLSRRVGSPLTFEQSFMLVVWSHWPLLAVGTVAWLLSDAPEWAAPVLAAAGIAAVGAATVRVWRDYPAVAGTSGPQAFLLGLSSPLCLVALTTGLLGARTIPYLEYLAHLAFRI